MRASAVWLLVGLVAACGGGSDGPSGPDDDGGDGGGYTDARIFALAQASGPWTYYKNRPDTLNPGSNSPHGRFRTRFDAKAAASLDAQGKVRVGTTFPDSALIVKEIYSGSTLTLLAVMLKARSDPAASAGGWLWAEYRPSGEAVFSIRTNSGVCTNCHVPGIDFTRMNDSHP